MSGTRLFSPLPLQTRMDLVLGNEQARYVGRVLRLRKGDQLTLFDGSGDEFPATIVSIGNDEIAFRLRDAIARNAESTLAIQLVQGVSRGERMDFVVQKATELGIHRIIPVLTEFSIVKLDPDRARRRQVHWQKIAVSACAQSGRNVVPQVDAALPYATWIGQIGAVDGARLLLDPSGTSLAKLANPGSNLILLVGPEGGLSVTEREAAIAAGFVALSLGPRILRTETAAITAIAALQTLFGDLG